jgi:ankyrin repeat protein
MQERKPLQKNVPARKLPIKVEIAKIGKLALSAEEQRRLDYDLIGAALNGENEGVVRSIRAGADATTKNMMGWTGLQLAINNGHAQACALLIREYAKAGGDVKKLIAEKGDYDCTTLHRAAGKESPEICALLVQEYANAGGNIKEFIAAKNKGSYTAHDIAKNYPQTAKFLTSIELLMDMETLNSFMKPFDACVAA